MTDISLETVAGKLNRLGYDAFMQALRHAKNEGNRHLELSHWLFHIVSNERSDISVTLIQTGGDRARLLADLQRAVEGLRKNVTEMPGISSGVTDLLDRGWHYATLLFGEAQIRSGHLLVAALKGKELREQMLALSKVFAEIDVEALTAGSGRLWAASDEEDMRPMDGSGIGPATSAGDGEEGGARGATPLGRFAVDMTEQASSGRMDPIVGRDDEIRQIVDILMRRRQNNPILTGEAGVGKTAVVEGFAQRLAAGDVPPQLRGNRLMMLDMGLLTAGASMKGEFEQRLRSVIDEVQQSPTPIILFIDEIHTLMGAGGNAGTNDAANLLKPALARGTLRTIGATTWMEYAKYFEKDPAMTRRFQPINVDEPSIDRACTMLRGIMGPMEAHHRVRISDEAIVAAVTLSARYIPARQLPDKAVSLLDTAAARVAISQATTPATLEDTRARIAALNTERVAKERQADLGEVNAARIDEIDEALATEEATLAMLEADYAAEKALVDEIIEMRAALAAGGATTAAPAATAMPSGRAAAVEAAVAAIEEAAGAVPAGAEETPAGTAASEEAPAAATAEATAEAPPLDEDKLRAELTARVRELATLKPDDRMIYAHVDEQSVASVVSDWTGIPVGRMVTDEVQAILKLPEILKARVVGQDHGLAQIARRIETNRARLDNPNKPIGVFMLCGPSGVGKTETALALADAIYGGEQNVITINMSEFQEAHTVSLLKGAPPGYVGYGEGGRLTEQVRRKPYSVVLLDEVEKAHPDVHELFFQVFDKGIMEDGSGRKIDFKNTVILLTSNVGTEVIMQMAEGGETRPDPEALNEALRPYLLDVFPPALIGRTVTIPYFPLAPDVLAKIARLKIDGIVSRVKQNHKAAMTYSDAVVDHIVSQCQDPDSGGRMIDNILTNTLLPELSRAVLTHTLDGSELARVEITLGEEGRFTYALG
ncbi:type VI secretion system ATPase TssH [Acidimangrovimonas sediminis]|uniref:type VI secretion system ATPase TssH n=1 Tax=Acidimangrovimonas sediminis TaxID=2056283 RepID=UPI000C80A3C9|nr:type VI secretion system ATPase TssH [Acidimangrovimonas sediminis]